MKITPEEVTHVANLARLHLAPQEVEDMAGQLNGILNYVAKLNELETADVEPMSHAISVTNAFREDEVRESLPQAEALGNGPRQDGETFIVPKVI